MYICRHIKKLGILCAILGFLVTLSSSVLGRTIYLSEDEFNINSDITYLDADNSSSDFIDLQFGQLNDALLRFDIVNNKFVFNHDVDFSGNELQNFSVENLASAPTCDASAQGRIYANTATDVTYVCNGTTWKQIDGETAIQIAAVQARRTTNFTLAALNTWYDIDFDTTDIESDATVLEHDIVNLDQIDIKVTGLYRITYHITANNASVTHQIDSRVRVNDLTILNGSELTTIDYQNEYGPMTGSFLASLSAGDYITMQASRGTTNTVINDTLLTVVKLDSIKGEKGDQGDAGVAGAQGLQGNTGAVGPAGDIDWQGAWVSQNYVVNQAVEYQGSSYVCILNTVSSEVPTNATYWDLVASKGDQGIQGVPGSVGAGTNSETFILDADDTGGDVALQFGTTLAEYLKWNNTTSRFDLSDDLNVGGTLLSTGIDLQNNTLQNMRVENLASAPVCDTSVKGKMYFNTTNTLTYVCNGTSWGNIDNTTAQTVIVVKEGGDFTSVKTALDSITDSSASKRYLVLIYPGIYIEDPMTIPDYVSLQGVGREIVTIKASTPSVTLLTSGLNSTVQQVTLQGDTGVTCLYSNTKTFVFDVELQDCGTAGIHSSGATAWIGVDTISVLTGTFTDMIKVDGGATAIISNLWVLGGNTTNVVSVTGDGTIVTISDAQMLSSDIVTTGIYVNNSATVNIPRLTVKNVTYGVHVGPTGSAVVQGPGGLLMNNTTDLYVESGLTKVFLAGWRMNKELLDIHEDAAVVLSFNDDTEGDESFSIFGELSVGTPEHPYESVFGEGDSYTNGMMVYTYNGAVYTDVSKEAESFSGSTFSLPGTGIDNAIYISTDRKDHVGSFAKFYGYKFKMGGTGLVLGTGELIQEYWNGTSWATMKSMCSHADLFYPYNADCFLRPNTDEQMRFGNDISTDWALNDPPSTGTNRYWMRLRVKTAITTAPVFEQFKVHSNRLEINADGTITRFGQARHRETFVVSLETIFYGRGTNAPDNRSFTVGSGGVSWTDERDNAAFNGATLLEEVTGSITLPKGIDTSNGLIGKVYWMKVNSNAGDVQWKLDYVVADVKNVKVASGTNVIPVGRTSVGAISSKVGVTVETTPLGDTDGAYEVIESEFLPELNIEKCYQGDHVFLRLYRDPTDIDDTYASDAIVVGFELSGVFWTIGEKLR